MNLKVLTIGNSFSICLEKNLPQIVKAGKKHHLILTSAYIGGCSLQTHAEHLQSAEKDPAISPYYISIRESGDKRKHGHRRGNVLELLRSEQYDIITIQQASHLSWDPNSYQPFADIIINYIKKYNPQAKIMIQQTWSYRCDCIRIYGPEKLWDFDSEGMYARLTDAYHAFAAQTGFDVIPTGDAVQLFRKKSKRVCKPVPLEQRKKYRSPDLPPSSDDVVGRFFYIKNEQGEMVLGQDGIHLNFRGEYLQACVWYGKLFGEDPENIRYEHKEISSSECRLMQKCAKEALAGTWL